MLAPGRAWALGPTSVLYRAVNLLGRPQLRALHPSLATASPAASSKLPDIRPHSDNEAAFWEQVLSRITKPQLANMRRIINPRAPLGLDAAYLMGINKKVQLHKYILECKKRYPESIILVQVGAFFEASGLDALVLAQFANMNLMAQATAVIPKAGFPINQLPLHVYTLNQEGFSVMVATEVAKSQVAKSRAGKSEMDRKVDFISTPARPRFFEPQTSDMDGGFLTTQRPVPPMIGIASTKQGFSLFTMHRDTMQAFITSGLTKEGLLSTIYGTGYATPVLMHDSTKLDPQSRDEVVRFIKRTASISMAVTSEFTGTNPSQGFVDKVKQYMFPQELQSGKDISIDMVPVSFEGRPRPPYLSTVMQLGLSKFTMGIPSLLDAVGGMNMPALSRHWLHSLLLMPPAREHAQMLQRAVSHFAACDQPRPLLVVSLTANKIVEIIETRQGNPTFFAQLRELVTPIHAYLDSSAYEPVVNALLPFCMAETGLGVHVQNKHLARAEGLRQELNEVLKDIEATVVLDALSKSDTGNLEGSKPSGRPSKSELDDVNRDNLSKFRDANEAFRRQVQVPAMQMEVGLVDAAYAEFEHATLQLFESLRAFTEDNKKSPPYVSYDKAERLSVVMSTGGYPEGKDNAEEYKEAQDRAKKHKLSGSVTTVSLQNRCDKYLDASRQAQSKAAEVLTGLCARLGSRLSALVLAAHLTVVMEALSVHSELKLAHGWCLPELLSPPTAQAPARPGQAGSSRGSGGSSSTAAEASTPSRHPSSTRHSPGATAHSLTLVGLRPYFLGPTDPAVTNDIEMGNNMWLLTGANMAGKSTVLRSIAAAALLGMCGLMVPCRSARIPAFDSIMLRNFSGDSPAEGKSSFRLEMEDTRCADQESTSRSLILADELGKGTEVDAGTAACAALATVLAKRGSTTVFATHLHGLVDLLRPLNEAGQLEYMRMGLSRDHQGKLRPTWRVEQGVCLESLAFNVAEVNHDNQLASAWSTRTRGAGVHFRASTTRLQDAGVAPKLVDLMRTFYSNLRPQRQLPHAQGGGVIGGSSSVTDSGTSSSSSSSSRAGGSLEESHDDTSGSEGGPVRPAVVDGSSGHRSSRAFWDQAAFLLREVVGASCESGSADPLPPVWHVGPNERVSGLHACNIPAVYIVMYANGELYCGQTTGLRDRLSSHRRKQSKKPWTGPGASMAYVLVPEGKQRVLEAKATSRICEAGIPLVSLHDRTFKGFPRDEAR